MVKNGNRAFFYHLKELWEKEPRYIASQVGPYLRREAEKRLIRFRGGESRALKFAWIMLTYRCNLRCEMCGLWGFGGIWKKFDKEALSVELSVEQLRAFLEQVAPFRPMVLLTGGEPMLYSRWAEVAAAARSHGLRVAMSTNATLLAEHAEAAVELLDVLEISLDGFGHIHNLVRKNSKAYEKVMEGIEAVERARQKGKATPYLNLSFTINNVNFRSILEFVDFLEAQPFPFHRLTIRHLESITREAMQAHAEVLKEEFGRSESVFRGYLYPVEPELKRSVYLQLRELLKRRLHRQGRVVFEPPLSLEEAKAFYEDSNFLPARYQKCFSPWLGASLLPNGELWICPDYPVGKITEESFLSLWNAPRSQAFRERLLKKGLFPACRTCASLYVY